MFPRLGDLAARRSPVVVVAWLILLVISIVAAPRWEDVVQNGEFAFLPDDAPSRIAERGFHEAFPDDPLASSVVLVVRRETPGPEQSGLLKEDKEFISQKLVPELHRLCGLLTREQQKDLEAGIDTESLRLALEATKASRFTGLAEEIQWWEDQALGDLLDSEDGQASLVVIKLTTEFLDQANIPLVDEVERLLAGMSRTPHDSEGLSIPPGLDITVSGAATFGRDMIRESLESAKSTERWTVALVVILLILIYRAPLLAVIPLITVGVSTTVALRLLSIAAGSGWLTLFNGIDTYIIVIVYGAGVDYCLFLIARYREELEGGATMEEAIAHTLTRVGGALTASAGTVMCGIGMMVFAEFGKFRQAGIAITFGLVVCLAAALTLTPAMLRLIGRWAFWPNMTRSGAPSAGLVARADWFSRLQRANLLQVGWQHVGRILERRPWTMGLASIFGLLPFCVIGITFFGFLSYGLMSELPTTSASVRGRDAVQKHFAAGEVGPVTVLMEVPGIDFSQNDSTDLVAELTDVIVEHQEELGLSSTRSLSAPKGQRPVGAMNLAMRTGMRALARRHYVSKQNASVTRLDLVFNNDPFSRSSIDEFRSLRTELTRLMPEELKDAKLSFLGITSQISDLKDVTDHDQIRIDTLVLAGVYIILVILLRRPGVCGYLIFSVFYSYLATLGITFLTFWALDPEGFAGLDWKVPMFLFTILIAVGEDYNIFLMSRIHEEQHVHGRVRGIIVALERTGSIISSCGIIMAGTFSSLLAGSLVGMDQLGFALAVGVLLDTFVVRPVMVPAFLVVLERHRENRELRRSAENR
ncbi:MAG: MMPL family transporter [Planctomycetaceae bacterium]|nr:MMPL family transporter [Planctomycetaceae bacterium]